MALRRAGFLGGAAAAAGVAALPRPANAVYGDTRLGATVTIAVVAPFTGDATALGEQLGNGVRAAIDEVNNYQGQLDKAFLIRTFDDQNLVASGIVNAQFACDDGSVVAVIGHLSGRVTEAALPTYVNGKMPVLCPASTYDGLTSHGYGNIVRLTTKDSSEGRLAGHYIVANAKPASAVVMTQDGDYGPAVAAGFKEQFDADKIPARVVSFGWQKPDYDAAVRSALGDTPPGVVFLAGVTPDMGPVLPRLRAAGYTGPIFGSQGLFDPGTIARYAAAAEGLVVSSSMPPLVIAPTAYRIRGEFERRYGTLTPLSAFAYSATQIVISIVRRTGTTDRIGLERSLAATSAYDTLVGPITFQNDGDPQNPNVYFYRATGGAWKYVGSAYPSAVVPR